MTPASPTAQPSKSAPAGPAVPPGLPPEWAIEKFVKSVGKGPAALARILDRLAKVPGIGHVVRLFSSVWFGISILILIGAYIALGSGNPEFRARLEMTDLQFFDAWPMRVLLVLLVTDLTVVTLRRIPLTLYKLGSWTVHIGIVTLIAGAVWYFWQKEEGAVRIYLHQSVDYCYDVTERALYVFPVKSDGTFDADHPAIVPIPSLPIFYEHLAETGNPLDIALPEVPGMPFRARVSGYYPFAILMPKDYRPGLPGEVGVGPALRIAASRPGDDMGAQWLIGSSFAKRVLEGDLPMGIEYLHYPSAERVKDLQTSFKGSMAITVRIAKLGIDRTYLVQPDVPIVVEGSGYTLTPVDYQQMPMVSKGYEGAVSTMLSIDVARKDGGNTFKFQRMCVFRYPERSPDFVTENGKQVRKQEGVDADLQIVFHDASQTQAWITEAESGAMSLIVRTPDGQSTTRALEDKPLAVPVPGMKGGEISLRVAQRTQNAVVIRKPEIIPPEQRPQHLTAMEAMQLSLIDLEISQEGQNGQGVPVHSQVFVPFSPYAAIGEPPVGQEPAMVELAGGKKVGLLLATTRRPLPTRLTLKDFKPVKYAGAQRTYADYISTLGAQDAGASEARTLTAHLNSPAEDHGLYYFQAAWDGDENAPPEKRFSVIGVANRPGIPVMVTGACLIILGVAFAFYIKPMVLKAKKESLARWAAQRA